MPQTIDQKRFNAVMKSINNWSLWPVDIIPTDVRESTGNAIKALPDNLRDEVKDRLEELYGNNADKY
jgi:hypothetical protein